MLNQTYIFSLLTEYWPYIFFILGAISVALVFYFLIGSLLELIYDTLVKHNAEAADVYGLFLNSFVSLAYLHIIKYWGAYISRHYRIDDLVILFMSLAWCLSIVSINEKFTSTQKFQTIVMAACLLGFVIWWLWGWLPAMYMWALVTFFFYVRLKNN